MKAKVVYDSAYGNTEIIAKEIAKTLKTDAILVNSLKIKDLNGVGLLVIGSPTQGGRPTKPIQDFLKNMDVVNDVKIAAFDTRILAKDQNIGLRILMKTIGYAAEKIANDASKLGYSVIAVEGFIVNDKEGPLKDGELSHASKWAKSLIDE